MNKKFMNMGVLAAIAMPPHFTQNEHDDESVEVEALPPPKEVPQALKATEPGWVKEYKDFKNPPKKEEPILVEAPKPLDTTQDCVTVAGRERCRPAGSQPFFPRMSRVDYFCNPDMLRTDDEDVFWNCVDTHKDKKW